jgi:hypothetical protein
MPTLTSRMRGVVAYAAQRREHVWNFSSSIGLKLVVFVLYFLAIPVLVGTKGAEVYGVIAFLIALLGYSSLLDNGLTYTVQLRYVRALSTRMDTPERVVRVAIPIYILLASIVFATLAPSGAGLSNTIWRTDAYAYVGPGLALLLALQVAGSLPAAVLLSHNRVALVNVARLAADVFRVGGLVSAAFANDPIAISLGFFVAGSAAKLAIDLFNCNRLVGLRNLRPAWSLSEMGAVLGTAWVMWLIAAMSLITLLYDKWFVSANISPADYAAYSIASDLTTKIYFVFYALSGAMYTPLMRRYATSGSSGRIYSIYISILAILATTYYMPLGVWSFELLNIYVGPEIAASGENPIRILAVSAVLYLFFNLMEMNLYARGSAHMVVPAYGAGIVALVISTPMLEARFGLDGVAASVLVMQATMLTVTGGIFSLARNRKAAPHVQG